VRGRAAASTGNARLKLRIQPLKFAKRAALIDRLIFDPKLRPAWMRPPIQHTYGRPPATVP
jgi:hypothetical protein